MLKYSVDSYRSQLVKDWKGSVKDFNFQCKGIDENELPINIHLGATLQKMNDLYVQLVALSHLE